MNDETGFLAAALKELLASTAVILAAWGALGGATNALTTKMRLRDALRHILLGGLIAAGMGSLSMAIITRWLGLPPEAIRPGRGRIGRLSGWRFRSCLYRGAARPSAPGRERRWRCMTFSALRAPCAATRPIPARPSATAWASASPSPR
ncbi:hypothetical protein FLP41_14140 [Paracoccus marcusii]|uniref:hypothetical protein n=1 Tax=Paracoccus marcusii TaxID=59779 RepID=UPI002ED656B3|nr:hypothetical protein FLP41_14140 [Paracoccus marcusii]